MPGEQRADRPGGRRGQSEQVLVVTADVTLAGAVASKLADEPENWIKDFKRAWMAYRLSCHRCVASQFRLPS